METPSHTVPKISAARSAFSLIEVLLAIGIVAFAFLAIFGLIPTGMNVFRGSINSAVTSQISQRVINDCQQTDFTELVKGMGGNSGRKATRYFDDQANELPSSTSAIYWVNTRVIPSTIIPGTTTPNPNLATVTVQIVSNPGGKNLDSGMADDLWTESSTTAIANYSAMVSKNQ